MKRFILLIALLLPILASAQIPAIEKLGKEAKRQKGVEYESVGSFMLGMASKMAPKEQRATFEMLDHIDMIVSEDNTYLATLETRLKAIIREGQEGRTFSRYEDWSYIPGGVISGTALIRPNFPELLVWPYLWQQTEYVLGGGFSHYMFLVLAVRHLL